MDSSNRNFIFCPHCGEKNLIGAKFCTHCGHSLVNIKTGTSFKSNTAAKNSKERNSNTATNNRLEMKSAANPNRLHKVRWKPLLITAIGIVAVILAIIGGKAFLDYSNQVNTIWYSNSNPDAKPEKKEDIDSMTYVALRVSGNRKEATFLAPPSWLIGPVLFDYKISAKTDNGDTYTGTLTNATAFAYQHAKQTQYRSLEEGKAPDIYSVVSGDELASKAANKNNVRKIEFQILKNNIVKITYLGLNAPMKGSVSLRKRTGNDFGTAKMMQEKLSKKNVKKVNAFKSSSHK